MEDNKNRVNLENIDDFIKDINSKIKNVEEKELYGKSSEEQQKLKKQWEKERLKNTELLKKQQDDFDNKMSKWKKKQKELMPIEKIKSSIDDMMEKLDMEWKEALKATIDELFKEKSKEEKEQLLKYFNDRLNSEIK